MRDRPCRCDRVTGPAWSPDQCRLCWLFHHDPRYRAAWGGGSGAGRAPKPCTHFRDLPVLKTGPNGEACSCRAKWLYECDLHGRCARTRAAARPGVPCCETCPDYEEE